MKSDSFEKRDGRVKIAIIYTILTIVALISLYPLLDIVKISLRPASRLFSSSLSLIPENATLENYRTALFVRPYFTWLKNSLFIAIASSLIGVALSITAAYAFSRYRFKGRSAGLVSVLLTQIFPAPMLLLPTYVLLKNFRLIDTYAGGIIPYIATTVPFSVWVLKGYFDTISVSIEESAIIDGAGLFDILVKIMVPLALPAIGVTLLNAFTASWNEFVVANIVFNDTKMHTLPLGIFNMTGALSADWGIFSAACLLTAVPVTVLFVAMSRVLIGGLTLGGVKE